MDSFQPTASLEALAAFDAVARHGTMGRAAGVLGRTQPTLSARLAGLESLWGARLFVRRARGMELTPEGRRLLPLARTVLHSAAALGEAAGRPGAAATEVRLGSGDALGRGLLPRALAALVAERPGINVRVREGSGARLLADLAEGAIDVALVPRPDAQAIPAGVVLSPLLECGVNALLPARGPLARRGARPPARPRPVDLAGLPLVVLLPGSSFRRLVEKAWAAAGVPLSVAVEVGSWSLVRRFVAAGLGVAPCPAAAFERDGGAEGGRVVTRAMAGVQPAAFDLATREGAPLGTATLRLVELLRAEAARGARA